MIIHIEDFIKFDDSKLRAVFDEISKKYDKERFLYWVGFALNGLAELRSRLRKLLTEEDWKFLEKGWSQPVLMCDLEIAQSALMYYISSLYEEGKIKL